VEEGEQHRGREGERVRFGTKGGHRRKSKSRSKRGSNRSDDGGSCDVDEVTRERGAHRGN
jgi:hypothetical protein